MSQQSVSVGLGVPAVGITDPGREEPELGVPDVVGGETVTGEPLEGVGVDIGVV